MMNFVELSNEELMNIDGGSFLLVAAGVGILAGGVAVGYALCKIFG